jgi:hypothetical protein
VCTPSASQDDCSYIYNELVTAQNPHLKKFQHICLPQNVDNPDDPCVKNGQLAGTHTCVYQGTEGYRFCEDPTKCGPHVFDLLKK